MRTPPWLSLCICAALWWSFPTLASAQTRVSEFTATEVLPAHAAKMLHAAITEAVPGSLVSVEGDRVKVRVPHGVSEAFILDVLQSAGVGSFTPVGRAPKLMDREAAGDPASGPSGPPGEGTVIVPTD